MRPLGYIIDWFDNLRCSMVGFTSPSPNFLNTKKYMMLTLAPISHKTLLKMELPMVQGIKNSLDL